MLNRKLSNYIFYGSLVAIFAVVFMVRTVVLGNIQTEIAKLEATNISKQQEIDALEAQVQEYKDIQTSHLYELYNKVPNIYSDTELTYRTVSLLEELGITESNDNQRNVSVAEIGSIAADEEIATIAAKYDLIEVEIFFTTDDISIVTTLIDEIYNDEQLFILSSLSYTVPTEDNYVGITINFIAVYDTKEVTAAQ